MISAGQIKHIQGLILDELAGWKFWRFNLEANLGNDARHLEYSIDADRIDKSARQYLTSANAQAIQQQDPAASSASCVLPNRQQPLLLNTGAST